RSVVIHNVLHKLLDGLRITGVTTCPNDRCALRSKRRYSVRDRCPITSTDGKPTTVRRKFTRDSQSQSASAPANDDHLMLEVDAARAPADHGARCPSCSHQAQHSDHTARFSVIDHDSLAAYCLELLSRAAHPGKL